LAAVWAGSSGLPSLQSYTGILDMPNARVVPDWSLRLSYGDADPYRYYGGAVGFWGRLEFHGQFTEVTTTEAFDGEGYGSYKDRAAGARLVLKREDDFWPQVAVGFFDATGTALFGTRYLVASKMLGNVDLTLGLGQGILAGEYVGGGTNAELGEQSDTGLSFLTSSPLRKTSPFGGIEWHASPRLTMALEYSPIDYGNMFGYVRRGQRLKEDDSEVPVNVGVKFRLNRYLHAHASFLQGAVWAGGIAAEFPLDAEGMVPWRKIVPDPGGERAKWQAYEAENLELARMVAGRLKREGFDQVAVSAGDTAMWIEVRNTIHLSDARALGHMAAVFEQVLPARIQTLYFNLKENGQVLQSMRTSRENLKAFLANRQNKEGFLTYANLELYGRDNWQEYRFDDEASPLYREPDRRFTYSIKPRIRTFLNNRKGFFKHKGIVQARGNYALWEGARLAGEFEVTLFNQFEDLAFPPLERKAVRTDLALYEAKSEPRVSMLALDQVVELPYGVLGRVSAGLFESAYAGFGAEVFRFFHDGLWGLGLESETVRKREVADNFALRGDLDEWFTTGFVNIYAQLWPAQGLEAGLKIGRFLAGDPGVRLEVRRAFKYFTLGAWYTHTDTSRFESEKNRGQSEKGVYIRIPFSIFRDRATPGHFRYEISSFTRDQGTLVRQPNLLYPMDPWSTPVHTRQSLEEMKIR
jgi:hypothetical protein